MKYLYPILLVISLSSCNTISETEEEELYGYLNGTFTSERHAERDSSYYDITLNISPIWNEEEDLWIYVEQALTNAPQNPYTQKIYKISLGEEGKPVMKPYHVPNPEVFHGGWKDPSVFEILSPEDLTPLSGCSIYFAKEDNRFVGKTKGKDCPSTTTGSEYTITQFTVEEDRLISWSRGFSADDSLIWGKTEGGYILEKVQ